MPLPAALLLWNFSPHPDTTLGEGRTNPWEGNRSAWEVQLQLTRWYPEVTIQLPERRCCKQKENELSSSVNGGCHRKVEIRTYEQVRIVTGVVKELQISGYLSHGIEVQMRRREKSSPQCNIQDTACSYGWASWMGELAEKPQSHRIDSRKKVSVSDVNSYPF